MKVCVQGLWHLGSVIAACLASVGHEVCGLDSDLKTVDDLSKGKAPLFEPGLNDLLAMGIARGKLKFSLSPLEALYGAEILWIAFDTPVDDQDQADVNFVMNQIQLMLPYLSDDVVVLISSQMPVGSTLKLEAFAKKFMPKKNFQFAYTPENLRLGKSLDIFLDPDRIVVGVRGMETRKILEKLFFTLTDRIEWMSIESAEMTKHAINAFLATSVTFANEIASICEVVGADAKEVERGLKTEFRIGPNAYLSPGGPFAGGTLARDIAFLGAESAIHQLVTPVLSAVRLSNDEHKTWVRRKLIQEFGALNGICIALWGLTYKSGTNTLRRSQAVELCYWLVSQGASVRVYDSAVKKIPDQWADKVIYCHTPIEAVRSAEALVIGINSPDFKEAAKILVESAEFKLIVIDANRYLSEFQSDLQSIGGKYIAVGSPLSTIG